MSNQTPQQELSDNFGNAVDRINPSLVPFIELANEANSMEQNDNLNIEEAKSVLNEFRSKLKKLTNNEPYLLINDEYINAKHAVLGYCGKAIVHDFFINRPDNNEGTCQKTSFSHDICDLSETAETLRIIARKDYINNFKPQFINKLKNLLNKCVLTSDNSGIADPDYIKKALFERGCPELQRDINAIYMAIGNIALRTGENPFEADNTPDAGVTEPAQFQKFKIS